MILGVELFELFLLRHRAYRLCVGILGYLPPMADLLRVQALLAAVGAELSGVGGSGLQYHRELVGSTPAFRVFR